MNNFIQNSIYQHNWIVPRSVMCTLFWTGVILVFTGMILLVTSNHKGAMYRSWGGVLLGLGLCVLLICLILCIHAYCVMAADAAATSGETEDNDDQTASTSAETKTNPCAVGDFHQPLTATTADVYSNSSLQANGRKPRSVAPLIPPPKFGVSVTKPATHTVRFFLSDANSSTQEGEEEEEEKAEAAVVQLQTMSKEETGKEVGRQMTSKTTLDTTTTLPGGRDVVGGGGNIRSSTGRRQSSPAKQRHIQNKTPASPTTPTVIDQRFGSSSDRNPVLLSSDCDSLLSVETIIPRTAPGNTAFDDQTREMTATPYSFLDDVQPQDVDEGDLEEIRQRQVIIDPNEGRLSSSSGSAKRKQVSSPFPGPFPSSVAKDGGKASHLSRQTNRHSYAKSKQQHYSSETSPSPGSPDLQEEAAAAALSSPPVKSAIGTKPQGPRTTPVMAPGAWSITRSFGPSSVTVTPLGTHEPPTTSIQNERHIKGGDGAAQVPYHPHHHQQHPQQHHQQHHRHQGGEFTQNKERARRENSKEDAVDQYRSSMKKDDPVGMWRSMERHRQQQWQQQPPVAAADRYMPSSSHPHPTPAPAALEITESKATVYDNVQYFQM